MDKQTPFDRARELKERGKSAVHPLVIPRLLIPVTADENYNCEAHGNSCFSCKDCIIDDLRAALSVIANSDQGTSKMSLVHLAQTALMKNGFDYR